MATSFMKVETDIEVCGICGAAGELMTPEEYDVGATSMQVPLRTMLLHLNRNKVAFDGRLCGECARRAVDGYEFSVSVSARAPPLADKLRALRRRLLDLTQKIDVFIVVGGDGSTSGAGAAYSEDDVIMVDRDALQSVCAAETGGADNDHQCTVCPLRFARADDLSVHIGTHATDAVHNCWTCGAQFHTTDALANHAREHVAQDAGDQYCQLCQTEFQSATALRSHMSWCVSQCPVCAAQFPSRGELSAHVSMSHGRGARGERACAVCFARCADAAQLSAHVLQHRRARHFLCGYDACILRFSTRDNLMEHIRKCHTTAVEGSVGPVDPVSTQPPSNTCDECGRNFRSVASLKRHLRVHQSQIDTSAQPLDTSATSLNTGATTFDTSATPFDPSATPFDNSATPLETDLMDGEEYQLDGEVEYLEMDTLEDI